MSRVHRLGRWARRGVLLLGFLLLTVGAVRLAIPMLLPSIADRLLAEHDLELAWDGFELVLRRGEVEFDGLTLSARGARAEPLVRIEHVRVDIDLVETLRSRFVIQRVYIDGLDVELVRLADGSSPLVDRIASLVSSFVPDAPRPVKKERAPLELGLPFELRAAGLQRLGIHWRDETMEPPVDVTVVGAVHLAHLGSRERKASLQAVLSSMEGLDLILVQGEETGAGSELELDLSVEMGGLRPHVIAGLLARAGLEPDARRLDGEFHLHARTQASSGGEDALDVSVEINDLSWVADDEPVVQIPSLRARSSALSAHGLEGGVVEIDGARLVASTSSAGVVVLGLGLAGGGPPAAEPGDRPEPDEPADEPADEPDRRVGGWPLAIETVAIRDAALKLNDRTYYPEVSYDLELDALELADLSLWRPEQVETASFELSARIPGMVDAVRIAGALEPQESGRELTSTVQLEGMHPSVMADRLASANLQTSLEAGTLECGLFFRTERHGQGPPSFSLGVEALRFADQAPLFELERLALEEVVYDRTRSFLRVGEIEIAGTRTTATMDPTGNLSALGLQTLPPDRAEPRTRGKTLAEAIDTLAAGILPRRETLVALLDALLPHEDVRFELGGLDWHDSSLALVDEGPLHEFGFEVSDLGAKVGAIVLDGRSEREEAEASVWLRSPGYVEEIVLDGSLSYGLRPIRLESRLELAGKGLEQSWLEPFLGIQGLEPTFGRGQFGVVVTTVLTADAEDMDLETTVADLFLAGDAGRLAGIESISLQGVHYDEGGLDLGVIEVVGPSLGVERHADGRLELMGLRPVEPVASEETRPGTAAPAVASAAPSPAPEPEGAAAGGGAAVALQRLTVSDGSLVWSDALEGVETNLGLSVELSDGALEARSLKAQYAFDLQADGRQHVRVGGGMELAQAGLRLSGSFAADGIESGPFAPYLPAGVAVDLTSGRIALDFDAEVGRAEPAGLAGKVAVRALQVGESDQPPLASLEEVRVEVSRLDLEAGEILVDELSARGVDLTASRGSDGALHAAGLAFSSAPEVEAGDAEGDAGGDRPARGGTRLKIVRVEHLDLELARLEVSDEQRPASAPLELGARLTNRARLDLLTPESELAETLLLDLRGFARPLVESIEVDCAYTADALSPSLSAAVTVGGIHGPALLELFPELEGRVDPSGLVGGSLGLKVEGGFEFSTRGRDFGLAGTLDEIELRDASGEVVGGIDRIYVDVPRIDPETGDVHIRTVGLLNPHGRTILREGEVEVAGLVFPRSPPPPPPSKAEAGAAPASAPAEASPSDEPRGGQPRGGELLVDEATISGIEVTLVDETIDPPVTIPIEDLYVEVRGLSSRALVESRPVRFEAYTNAGIAQIPGKKLRRPTLEELAVEGWLELFPKRAGWFRINVAGLDLLPLQKRAAESGIRIKDGMLDTSINATIKDGQLRVDSRTNFTDLSVSENEGGPIQSTLKLPVPLNAAIVLLENSNGELIIPLSFTMKADQISRSDMFVTVTATLSQVLLAAIAKSPFRITDTAAQFIGLSQRDERKAPRVKRVQFAPGDGSLEEPQRALVRKLREVLAKGDSTIVMVHEVGSGDRDLVVRRATPSKEETDDLVELLRQRRREFAHLVTLATARGRTRMATGDEAGWREAREDARKYLSDFDRAGEALDEMSQLRRLDASEHRAHREGRLMTQLGWLRLDSVYSVLVEGLPPEAVSNVMLRRPLARHKSDGEGGAVVLTVRERK